MGIYSQNSQETQDKSARAYRKKAGIPEPSGNPYEGDPEYNRKKKEHNKRMEILQKAADTSQDQTLTNKAIVEALRRKNVINADDAPSALTDDQKTYWEELDESGKDYILKTRVLEDNIYKDKQRITGTSKQPAQGDSKKKRKLYWTSSVRYWSKHSRTGEWAGKSKQAA